MEHQKWCLMLMLTFSFYKKRCLFFDVMLHHFPSLPLVVPHAPCFRSNYSAPMLASPQSLSCKIWRLLTLPPKMKRLFWNSNSHKLYTSCPLKSNVVDNSPLLSISRGLLLSSGVLTFLFFLCQNKESNKVNSLDHW